MRDSATLTVRKSELDDITRDTQKEEEQLDIKSEELQTKIEERLLTAYKRIRTNARNGLAVVSVQRDACGGCFNQIPPQRQLDIRSRKKIIVCEYCGRILVDDEIVNETHKQDYTVICTYTETLHATSLRRFIIFVYG